MFLKLDGVQGTMKEVAEIPSHAKRVEAAAPGYQFPTWVRAVFEVCGHPLNHVRTWAWNFGRPHETIVWCEIS